MNLVLNELNRKLGFPVYLVSCIGGVDESQFLDTQKGMIHADEVETSIVLAYNESLVIPAIKNFVETRTAVLNMRITVLSAPSIIWNLTQKTVLWEMRMPRQKRKDFSLWRHTATTSAECYPTSICGSFWCSGPRRLFMCGGLRKSPLQNI